MLVGNMIASLVMEFKTLPFISHCHPFNQVFIYIRNAQDEFVFCLVYSSDLTGNLRYVEVDCLIRSEHEVQHFKDC